MPKTGRQITIPAAFISTVGLPQLRDDALLTTGSLLLLDCTHEARDWPASVPAAGSTYAVPNIAYAQCLTTIATGGGQSTVDATYKRDTAFTGTVGICERTGKGAVHGIVSQTNNTAQNQGAGIIIPDPIKTWLLNNPTHLIYMSQWEACTRVATQATINDASAGVHGTSSPTSNALFLWGGASATLPSTAGGQARVAANPQALGTILRNGATAAWAGTAPTTLATMNALLGAVGSFSGDVLGSSSSNATPYNNKRGSRIFYRAYLEDLTVSGRSYTTVDALDLALYTAAFAAGGRYTSDTYTTPAI